MKEKGKGKVLIMGDFNMPDMNWNSQINITSVKQEQEGCNGGN